MFYICICQSFITIPWPLPSEALRIVCINIAILIPHWYACGNDPFNILQALLSRLSLPSNPAGYRVGVSRIISQAKCKSIVSTLSLVTHICVMTYAGITASGKGISHVRSLPKPMMTFCKLTLRHPWTKVHIRTMAYAIYLMEASICLWWIYRCLARSDQYHTRQLTGLYSKCFASSSVYYLIN